MIRSISIASFAACFALTGTCLAEETLVGTVNLPGATLNQEITYSTTKREYEAARDKVLSRLKKGESAAFVNPKDGPWMRVETTATIGLSIRGVGASSGRKNLRQISATEEALYLYEQSK